MLNNMIYIMIVMSLLLFAACSVDHQMEDGHEHEEHNHEHTTREVKGDIDMSINVYQTKNGWLLNIDTQNFELNEQAVDTEYVPGQGHAHLYVNGEKVGRVYQHNYTIENMPEGEVEIRVTLSSNVHEELYKDGKLLEDSVVIEN